MDRVPQLSGVPRVTWLLIEFIRLPPRFAHEEFAICWMAFGEALQDAFEGSRNENPETPVPRLPTW